MSNKIFLGYLQSNGKIPLTSVKDESNWLVEPPEKGDYCGVLSHDMVQLDFDDEKSSRIALAIVKEMKLQCDILQTSRGIHLYFKSDGSIKSQSVHVFNALGIPCDIGLGVKNRVVPLVTTKEIETTKIVDGNEIVSKSSKTTKREWLQTYDKLDILPSYFRPISKIDYNLSKADSRNQTLFEYILKLQMHNFTRDEVRITIKMINRHILYEPLPEKEVDVITRDESFSEELFFSEKGRFLHDRFGNYMLTNSHILLIDGQPFIYTNDKLYSNDPMEFERQMIMKIPSLKDNQRKEVYKYIGLQCVKVGEFASSRYVGLKSTILDIETMEHHTYSPKWVINNRINIDYNESAYSEVLDRTLNKVSVNDEQIRALFEEMVGYTLYRKNSMQVCFILTGEGSNGKSTLLNVVKKLIGKQNYTSLDLRQLEDTFAPSDLYNKLANIGDDISAKYLEGTSVFKKVVTGESLMVARKYGQPFELESYATQIFCANELPQVHDRTDGFSRRIMIMPFNAKFSKDDVDYDPFIESKLLSEESIQYLLTLAIKGLRRVIIDRQFTKSVKGEGEKSAYMKLNNNILEWLEDDPQILNEQVSDIYMQYQLWCGRNGCNSVKQINFSKEIKKQTSLISKTKSIDGKSVRVYTEPIN